MNISAKPVATTGKSANPPAIPTAPKEFPDKNAEKSVPEKTKTE